MTKNITKIDISKELSKKFGFSISLSKKIINDIVLSLISNLDESKLTLKNIGSFKILNKKERLGRNPKTGDNFLIKARKSVSFSPSKELNKKINN